MNDVTAERVRRVIRGVPTAKDDNLKNGLGGAFSYFQLGAPMRQESLLDGSRLPDFETLAGYLFFTATGAEHDPADVRKKDWFVGRSKRYDVFLIYEPDVTALKEMALTLEVARKLPDSDRQRSSSRRASTWTASSCNATGSSFSSSRFRSIRRWTG